MAPKFINDEIDRWRQKKLYGELKIFFQNGVIHRVVSSESKLAPKGSESMSLSDTTENSGTNINQEPPTA